MSNSEPIYRYPSPNQVTHPLIITPTGSFNRQYLCPDLLSIRQIGGADGWRGKVVRIFFRALKVVTGV